ncbi:MAG: AAA family ATPase [Thermoplasmatales archaeon]|nr:AAA family ATPase [Thermoplasmatales archaeon]
MAKRSITIGGLPGAGTTTVAKMLAEKTGMTYINVGEIYRDIADRKSMPLLDFEKYSEAHPEIDVGIDKKQEEIIRKGNAVVEGRLSGWIAHLKKIPAIKIWLDCDENERIRRIVEREGGEIAEKRKETKEREESEARRYKKFYGIDLNDKSIYDIVIDTTSIPAEEVLNEIIEKIS